MFHFIVIALRELASGDEFGGGKGTTISRDSFVTQHARTGTYGTEIDDDNGGQNNNMKNMRNEGKTKLEATWSYVKGKEKRKKQNTTVDQNLKGGDKRRTIKIEKPNKRRTVIKCELKKKES